MGCNTSSSLIHPHTPYIHRKPQLWFIMGGPGSNKGKIIEYLVRDYKFMYLSLFEMLQFEKQRQTPEAQIIKKTILQKKDFSTQIITQLLKKAIAALGPRRYLIDGFPRNQNDLQYFEKQPFIKELVLQKLIHIEVSVDRMRLTGMEAKKEDKRQESEVKKQVENVIDEYKRYEEKIIQFYTTKKSLISVPERATEDETYNQLRLQLQNLPRFRQLVQGDARVFFCNFSNPSHQLKYTYEQFTKGYGLCHLNYNQLINECRHKINQDSKYLEECEKKKQLPSSQFVIYLFRKCIEKRDYVGNFLVTGFPRNINDAVLWDKNFGWEVGVQVYIDFCSEADDAKHNAQDKLKVIVEKAQMKLETENNQSSADKNLSDKKVLIDFYSKQQKYAKIPISKQQSHQSLTLLHSLMTKKSIPKRNPLSQQKLVFMSTINQQFTPKLLKYGAVRWVEYDEKTKVPMMKEGQPQKLDTNHIKQINMLYCYENEGKENGLYSDLIKSFIASGVPVPGYVAVKILLKNLEHLISTQGPKHSRQLMVIVKGFPNSVQQLIMWNQQVGETYPVQSILYFETNEDRIRQVLAKHKVEISQEAIEKIKKNSLQLEEFLKPHDTSGHKMKDQKNAQDFISYLI